MEKEIEKILNDTYYLTFKVWQEETRIYFIKIEEIKKTIAYKFDYRGLNFDENMKILENIICNNIINYYRK